MLVEFFSQVISISGLINSVVDRSFGRLPARLGAISCSHDCSGTAMSHSTRVRACVCVCVCVFVVLRAVWPEGGPASPMSLHEMLSDCSSGDERHVDLLGCSDVSDSGSPARRSVVPVAPLAPVLPVVPLAPVLPVVPSAPGHGPVALDLPVVPLAPEHGAAALAVRDRRAAGERDKSGCFGRGRHGGARSRKLLASYMRECKASGFSNRSRLKRAAKSGAKLFSRTGFCCALQSDMPACSAKRTIQ